MARKRREDSTLTSKASNSRNNGQWTEARYKSFIVSVLRAGTRRWPPKWAALKAAFKRQGENPKTKRLAKLYGCALCDGEFSQKDVQVDHINPVKDWSDWNKAIEALYCEVDNLQVLCKPCHKKKTKEERPLKSAKVSKPKKVRSSSKVKSTPTS